MVSRLAMLPIYDGKDSTALLRCGISIHVFRFCTAVHPCFATCLGGVSGGKETQG
jgi:hypothetical protein